MWHPGQHTQCLEEAPVDEDARTAAFAAMSGELASHNTYGNIVANKSNIDYCIDQFNFLSSRIKCIKLMTGNGPFLA